jgi:hypothetical protein
MKMKKILSICFIYCLTLILILGAFQFCFAESIRSGSFSFAVGKNNLDVENVDVDLDLYLIDPNKVNSIGTQIDFEMSKEQDLDELSELNVLVSLQGDYFFAPEWYGFGGVSYERNLQWFDDLITFGAGGGYKISDLSLQAGLYWATIYNGNEYDRQGLLKVAGDYKREIYKPIDLTFEAEGVINLEEVGHGFDEYRLDTFTMIKVNVSEKIFIGVFYDWDYFDDADVTSQWEYGVRGGWNFI